MPNKQALDGSPHPLTIVFLNVWKPWSTTLHAPKYNCVIKHSTKEWRYKANWSTSVSLKSLYVTVPPLTKWGHKDALCWQKNHWNTEWGQSERSCSTTLSNLWCPLLHPMPGVNQAEPSHIWVDFYVGFAAVPRLTTGGCIQKWVYIHETLCSWL